MAHADGKIELTEEEINDPGMNRIRESALKMVFEKGILKSSPIATTMETPRYMAKLKGTPVRYEWVCRITTTRGHLDAEGVHPAGLFKFTVVTDGENKEPVQVNFEQVFV